MAKEKTSIIFTGDIGFDRYMDRRWEDENLLAKPVLDFFHSADHTVANVEGALIDAVDDGSRGVFFHSMNPAAVSVLKKMGADIWSIGNNHIMDAGREGVVSTRKMAGEHGCRAFGAGVNLQEASEPVYLDEAGGIGMFGVSYMAECIPATETEAGIFRWDDLDTIAARISEIKAKCRWCVVVSHGGEEFTSLPSPYTRDRYLKFLELGADVVVAHHPHVPENYELFDNGKAIFYSLGNFIFDTNYQRVHLYTDVGVLLKLTFTQEKVDFDAIGIRIVRGDERIDIAPLPDVFTHISAEEYDLLAPLSAKAFVKEDMRKMIYLEPERFTNAPQEVWDGYFFSEEPDGYFKDAHMDFGIIVPFAQKAEEGLWKQSRLEKVKAYILRQLEDDDGVVPDCRSVDMNHYDHPAFFSVYAQMARSREGLAGAGEWEQFKLMFPDLKGKDVLDLGCGYGWHCRYAADQGARSVLGIDQSERMIAEAQKRNSGSRIAYRVCPLHAYDYPAESFDVAVSNLVLHYVEDLDEIYRCIHRTLRPDGVFLMNIEHPTFTAGVNQQFAADGTWPVDQYYVPGMRQTEFLGHKIAKYHHTLTQILMGLIRAGFILEAVEEAMPPEAWRDAMPEELRRPMMLLVKARKKMA